MIQDILRPSNVAEHKLSLSTSVAMQCIAIEGVHLALRMYMQCALSLQSAVTETTQLHCLV
eukprot:8900-Heterococcus_DN1.PRE.1